MAVKVRCPGCQKVLTAPDEARGKAIKCPACETRVPIPSGSGGAAKPAKKKAASVVEDESGLASLDLRNVEDAEARVCPKCGHDMQYQDEEETECPKCGYDTASGGLGEKARKKRLKGPDPDKFYEGLWKKNWKFVFRNQGLAWRTMIYTVIASLIMFGCAFAYLRIPMWPPRVFFGFCTLIAAMMIPGWLWFMDEQVIVGTLTKKDKLKRINFDFFLCSALGIKWVAWHLVFASLVLAIPGLIGLILTQFGGMPDFVLWICLGVGYLPVLAMLPIVMGHMVMPIQAPGWMVWKVFPAWIKTLKPTLLWLTLTLMLHLPVLGILATIAAVSGNDVANIAQQMEENAETHRARVAAEAAPKKDAQAGQADPIAAREFHTVNYMPLILPGGLWVLACVFLGFPALYSCRLNGQFVYFFREQLDLQALAKEYKYVAKVKPEDEEDKPPKTLQQVLLEAVITVVMCTIIGAVFGMVASALSAGGSMLNGLMEGAFYGSAFASVIGRLMLLTAAWNESTAWGLIVWWVPFGDVAYVVTHWEDGRGGCLVSAMSGFMFFILLVLAIIGILSIGGLSPRPGGGGAQPEFDPGEAAGGEDAACLPRPQLFAVAAAEPWRRLAV
jgi:DNA-directed RNA polymerase subunit M/transcription elongation factor TFIIS